MRQNKKNTQKFRMNVLIFMQKDKKSRIFLKIVFLFL